MKYFFLVLTLGVVFSVTSQNLALKKGMVIDSIPVNDTIPESYALYLPKAFDTSKSWPIVFVFDMKGRGQQSLNMFREAAEKQGYLLAASNHIQDSLSIADNIVITGHLLSGVAKLFPIDLDRVYTAGNASGGRFASMIPAFVKNIAGVISIGAPVANLEVLSSKNPFHFIGLVGTGNFNYPEMLYVRKELNKKRFPNRLLVYEGTAEWPRSDLLGKALETATLAAMAKKHVTMDIGYVNDTYRANLNQVNNLMTDQKALLAHHLIEGMISVYQPYRSIDSLRNNVKTIKRSKLYRSQNRSNNNALFKESFVKDDYDYYLEEDVRTYNYNNLGWWTYQMEEIAKYEKNSNVFTQQMGQRLRGYLNALVEDTIELISLQEPVDLEALNFLWMLKTITAPKEYDNYLKVISNSSLIDDYGTALFYLEELLKNGYTDKETLYTLEHTALLRISPEYNELIAKYLKDARYEPIEE